MAVPDFQSLVLPSLRTLSGAAETPIADIRARVAESGNLSTEDLREMVPSGRQTVFTNRVSWAVIHMERAGLVERVRHAVYRMTEDGERLTTQNPARIDMTCFADIPLTLSGGVPVRPHRKSLS